jgi:hypothetical protein
VKIRFQNKSVTVLELVMMLLALCFTATGASLAANFANDSACLTAYNIWNEGK